jgi:hypothetical protein
VAGAFGRTVGHSAFKAMVEAGAVPILMTRLTCMDALRALGAGFYRAAGDGIEIDPVEQFMVEDWLADLKARRVKAGASVWLP